MRGYLLDLRLLVSAFLQPGRLRILFEARILRAYHWKEHGWHAVEPDCCYRLGEQNWSDLEDAGSFDSGFAAAVDDSGSLHAGED